MNARNYDELFVFNISICILDGALGYVKVRCGLTLFFLARAFTNDITS